MNNVERNIEVGKRKFEVTILNKSVKHNGGVAWLKHEGRRS